MNAELLNWLASCNKDPFAFVMGAFPWNVPGSALADFSGPDPWQTEILQAIAKGLLTPNEAIQLATASGHGIGKSCLVAWIILWAFMTSPDMRGVVTANTETQLKTKTWSELGKWFNLCFFAREHFQLTATALLSKDVTRERTWRIDMVPWSEKNTEAFAGLHNKGKRLLLIMDEASAIPDIIWETAEGALTDSDTEIMWIVFGNPTRNTGRFKECFEGGQHAEFWNSRQIDSRDIAITNKSRLAAWIKTYGEDSDFVRIRVKGMFPRVGEMEFFSAEDIDRAMSEERASEVYTDVFTPLALGVDVARYGKNNSVIWPRKGRDARSIRRRVYNHTSTVELANRIHEAKNEWRPDGIFIDEGGVGGGVVDNCRDQRLDVIGVQFGGKDIITALNGQAGEKYANMRAAMYGALRQWIKNGCLPADPEVRRALMAIRYTFTKKDEILLVSKEDLMEENPDLVFDDIDALALTFGGPLAKNSNAGREGFARPDVEFEYDPFSEQRMAG